MKKHTVRLLTEAEADDRYVNEEDSTEGADWADLTEAFERALEES